MQVIYSTLIKELHQMAKNKQSQRAVVGLSGGIDSAVALCIAIRAFGPKNVTALILPEVGLTSNEDIDHAKALADHFGCHQKYQPINNFLVDYSFVTWDKTDISNELLKTRVRSTLIKHFAEANNSFIVGTANKSDILLGQGEADGEFIGDLHVIGDLFKTEVWDLAKFIGLPQELLHKAASRCLKPYQTDEGDLGATWPQIDDILRELSKKTDPETLIQKGMDSLIVHKIARRIQQADEKNRQLPAIPVGRISESIKKAQEAEASSM